MFARKAAGKLALSAVLCPYGVDHDILIIYLSHSGGRADFKWSDVQGDQHRENYLGHSLMARRFLLPYVSMHSLDSKDQKPPHSFPQLISPTDFGQPLADGRRIVICLGTLRATIRKLPNLLRTPAQRRSSVLKKQSRML